jgi:hypothetical protein
MEKRASSEGAVAFFAAFEAVFFLAGAFVDFLTFSVIGTCLLWLDDIQLKILRTLPNLRNVSILNQIVVSNYNADCLSKIRFMKHFIEQSIGYQRP